MLGVTEVGKVLILQTENDIINLTCINIPKFFTYKNRASTKITGTKILLAEILLYNKSTLAESSSFWLKWELYTKNVTFESPTWIITLDRWKTLLWKCINAMRFFFFFFFFYLPDGSSLSSFLGDMGVLTRNHNRNYSLES